jgi:hypothetical protein
VSPPPYVTPHKAAFFFPFSSFVLICPIRPFPHIRSKPGFTFSDMGHLVRNNTIDVSIPAINIRTTAAEGRWSRKRRGGSGCLDAVVLGGGRGAVSRSVNDKLGRLITVTESRGYQLRTRILVPYLDSAVHVSCEPAILLHHAGICLTCHLCRGNSSLRFRFRF